MPRQFVPWQMILSPLKIVSLQKRKPSTHFSRYMKAEIYQNPHWKLKIISLFHTRIIIELPEQFPDVCFGFALFRSVVGPQNPLSFPNLLNSRVKLATSSLAFSRAWNCLLVFTWSFHRLPVIFSIVLIGCYQYFEFGFPHLIDSLCAVDLNFPLAGLLGILFVFITVEPEQDTQQYGELNHTTVRNNRFY